MDTALLNRGAIARSSGLTRSGVSRILSRQRVPSFRTAKLVADAIGVTLDELYRSLYENGNRNKEVHS